jgi:hypothetical protein
MSLLVFKNPKYTLVVQMMLAQEYNARSEQHQPEGKGRLP